MYFDIVFPNQNEKAFLDSAEKLGHDGICFVYSFENFDFLLLSKRLDILQTETRLKVFLGLIVKPKQVNKARKIADLILIKSSKENRYVFEKSRPDILFGLEQNPKPDSMHIRTSGLNQVLCKLANKNKIIIGFSFLMILKSNDESKQKIIGRISQNIKLCRKYKVETLIASFAEKPYHMRSGKDFASFLVVLGMHPKQAKDSISSLGKRLEFNVKSRNKEIIAEGIEIVD